MKPNVSALQFARISYEPRLPKVLRGNASKVGMSESVGLGTKIRCLISCHEEASSEVQHLFCPFLESGRSLG